MERHNGLSAASITKIIKQASENGVKKLELNGDHLLIEFSEDTIEQGQVQLAQWAHAPEVARDLSKLDVDSDEGHDESLSDDELLLVDPLAYEQSIIDEHNNQE